MEQILISFCGQSTMQLSFIPVNFVSGWFPMVGEPTNSGMTENDMKALTGDIIRHLSAKKLKEAFTLVKKLVAETWLGEFSDKVYDLEETYSFIRKYTIEGVEDPEREKIYRHLVQSLIGLTSRIRENWLTTHSGSPFYLRKRSPDLLPLRNPRKFLEDLAHSQKVESPWNHGDTGETGGTPDLNDFRKEVPAPHPVSPEYWQQVEAVFYAILLTDEPDEEASIFINALFDDDTVPQEGKAVWITALTFSLLRYFDEAKMALHLDLYEKFRGLPQLSQRCLTGFLTALYQYAPLMRFYPQTTGRFTIMNEDPAFNRQVERILLQLLGSRETEKIKQKIQEEIIPEMIRISPNIRNKFNIDHLMNPESDDDRNPEWSTLFDDSPGLIDKMEEMAQMQSEGADVFLASFGMFKRFPFFNELVNWFVPFFPGHPEMPLKATEDPENTVTRITDALLQSPMLCNSDKYSFAMMLQTITPEARSMMAGFLQAEMEQLEELGKEEAVLSPDRKETTVSNQYIQDMYRFFRLYPSEKGVEDIFSWKFDYHNRAVFRPLLEEHPAMINKLAEFYFEKGYFEEALEIFGMSEEQSGEALQKAAWCHQKMGRYEQALELYKKAELYEVNKIWNLKKIALCYRNLKLPEEALKVYQNLDVLQPDNLGTLYAMGYCQSETGRTQEALNTFFKIEYLSPGNKKVWRPIAWCSFLTGKNTQAERYYHKLLEEQSDKYDLMNMGHVQWVQGKRATALDYYRLSIVAGGFSEAEFMTVLEEDLHFLLERGIDPNEVHILLDHLRYTLGQ